MASVSWSRKKIEVSQVTRKGIVWKLLERHKKDISAPVQSYYWLTEKRLFTSSSISRNNEISMVPYTNHQDNSCTLQICGIKLSSCLSIWSSHVSALNLKILWYCELKSVIHNIFLAFNWKGFIYKIKKMARNTMICLKIT